MWYAGLSVLSVAPGGVAHIPAPGVLLVASVVFATLTFILQVYEQFSFTISGLFVPDFLLTILGEEALCL